MAGQRELGSTDLEGGQQSNFVAKLVADLAEASEKVQ